MKRIGNLSLTKRTQNLLSAKWKAIIYIMKICYLWNDSVCGKLHQPEGISQWIANTTSHVIFTTNNIWTPSLTFFFWFHSISWDFVVKKGNAMFSYRGRMHDTPSSRKVSGHTFKIFIVNIQVNISEYTMKIFLSHFSYVSFIK